MLWAAGGLAAANGGCAADKTDPIKIGFIGSIKSYTGDHDRAGRDGALLAVSEINDRGGIQERPLELMIVDDEFSPARAMDAVRQLSHRKAVAIIGPMTSRMGLAVAQTAQEEAIVALSPAVSTERLSGKDDNFLRIYPQTRVGAWALADALADSGVRLAHAIRDISNPGHTGEFSDSLFLRLRSLGTTPGNVVDFAPRQEENLSDVVGRLALSTADGQAVVLLSTPPNVGLMAQILRRRFVDLQLAASEWAASSSLIAMGGAAVEGLMIAKLFNDEIASGRSETFRNAFFSQFFYEPTFPAACGYEAVHTLAVALAKTVDRQKIKKTLLTSGPYQGLQDTFDFDRFGDVIRPMTVMEIRSGRFVAKPMRKG